MVKFVRNKTAIVSSAFAAFFLLIGAKVYQYASAPLKPKDCNFIYPESTNQAKPTSIIVESLEQLPNLLQKGGFINDASCLNKTSVYGIVTISSENDVKTALAFARENKLQVTSAGQQHSMGGQSFVRGGLVLNMKGLNAMKLDTEKKILTVQSGATWADVQQYLDKQGLAVWAMQSINIFTVGGTLSVNAHGIAHDPGQIGSTVKSMRVMLADGQIKTASPTQNPTLFKAVIGGYGLAGVILDVDLQVVENEMYSWTRDFMDYKEFPEYYKNSIEGNKDVGLMYGRLSVSPTSYLTQTVIHTYTKTQFDGEIPNLKFPSQNWVNRLVFNISKTGALGRWIRWFLEKHVEPKLHLCSRNQAMSQKEVCNVTRNQEMYSSMGYLKNKLKDTDILQEYFIPHDKMVEFVDGLRKTVQDNGANLLNVTIRIVSKDTVSSLPYAKEDMFAFVLYFNQRFNELEAKILEKTTTDLIDVATSVGGAYYLPYQLYYSQEQLHTAYPEIDAFFAQKKTFDPGTLFTNTFYEKYGK